MRCGGCDSRCLFEQRRELALNLAINFALLLVYERYRDAVQQATYFGQGWAIFRSSSDAEHDETFEPVGHLQMQT